MGTDSRTTGTRFVAGCPPFAVLVHPRHYGLLASRTDAPARFVRGVSDASGERIPALAGGSGDTGGTDAVRDARRQPSPEKRDGEKKSRRERNRREEIADYRRVAGTTPKSR
ncbi:hypothetical protein BG842_24160 [Haladaptatus sp. W1]|uniref:hypothetical protein n=1 Tax=Haladaptatus sp. W1 TaxID=1897478 RepID=UPI000849771E|nr:hypothetical protein [Haladaptatus sp. W1]ODR79889.1 hypothetical protein BG842_24160 [Haladaptatus sp. W1]